jgi:hypothetical protein
MQRITIEVAEADEDQIKKSFQGKWLIQDVSPERDESGVTWHGRPTRCWQIEAV